MLDLYVSKESVPWVGASGLRESSVRPDFKTRVRKLSFPRRRWARLMSRGQMSSFTTSSDDFFLRQVGEDSLHGMVDAVCSHEQCIESRCIAAMMMLAGESAESASDVVVYGMVSRFPTSLDHTTFKTLSAMTSSRERLVSWRPSSSFLAWCPCSPVSLDKPMVTVRPRQTAGHMERSMHLSPMNKVLTDLKHSTLMSRTYLAEWGVRKQCAHILVILASFALSSWVAAWSREGDLAEVPSGLGPRRVEVSAWWCECWLSCPVTAHARGFSSQFNLDVLSPFIFVDVLLLQSWQAGWRVMRRKWRPYQCGSFFFDQCCRDEHACRCLECRHDSWRLCLVSVRLSAFMRCTGHLHPLKSLVRTSAQFMWCTRVIASAQFCWTLEKKTKKSSRIRKSLIQMIRFACHLYWISFWFNRKFSNIIIRYILWWILSFEINIYEQSRSYQVFTFCIVLYSR